MNSFPRISTNPNETEKNFCDSSNQIPIKKIYFPHFTTKFPIQLKFVHFPHSPLSSFPSLPLQKYLPAKLFSPTYEFSEKNPSSSTTNHRLASTLWIKGKKKENIFFFIGRHNATFLPMAWQGRGAHSRIRMLIAARQRAARKGKENSLSETINADEDNEILEKCPRHR